MKHLFLANRAYSARKKAKIEVEDHLGRMRKSIIRMSLSYSDLDRLKEKMQKFMATEAMYAKFFKTEDPEARELKSHVDLLEHELSSEKEEKSRLLSENEEKVRQLSQSLENIKSQMKVLHLDKAKRQQRLNALERKINGKIDMQNFYSY